MGLAVAKYLAANHWHVSIADIDEEKGDAAASNVNGLFTKTDVSFYEDIAKAFSNTWKKYGRIDFVFSNAGILESANFYEQHETLPPPKLNLLTSEVNLNGAIYSCYLAMNYFRQNKEKGGCVIITGSAAGIYANPIFPVYCASKHGVVGLVRGLGRKLAKENIRVNAILPGPVDTNILASSAVPLFAPGEKPPFGSEVYTKEQNIVDAVMTLLDDPNASGTVLEISRSSFYDRKQPEWSDDNMRLALTSTVY
ncbi:NAD(P)-binding protein [Lepidopterella palustris CBS 459.81]|uniref:NAD(P)-binding protein n=1 Tax=Lepidopterella palustris CBS 459.81 TaxID=1314670 RepID=A0A8E2DZ78_9PEZI|nr:NAD(P)-binding protein [Lepidopterella palustris CBS 459.81]